MLRMQPQNRVMVPSQELPIQIYQQVQPVDKREQETDWNWF